MLGNDLNSAPPPKLALKLAHRYTAALISLRLTLRRLLQTIEQRKKDCAQSNADGLIPTYE